MMFRVLNRKWITAVLISLLLIIVLVPTAIAAEIFEEETVIIKAGEVIDDDLIVFANNFVMDGTVKGDLLVFANKATINGIVEGDILGGAQELILNGTVQDDVRMGGMVLTLGEAALIGDDLLAGGYSLESKAGSLVEGNMYFGVAQSRLAGDVLGDLWMSGGGLELLGTVGGDVQAEVGSAADAPAMSPFTFMPDAPPMPAFPWGFTIGEQAEIGGDLSYTSPVAATIPANVVTGDVVFEEVVVTPTAATEEVVITPAQQTFNWIANFLRQFVTLLLIGAIMIWIAPHWTNKVSYFVQDEPLPTLGWGLLTVALVLVTIVLTVAVVIMVALLLGALTFADLVGTVLTLGAFVTFGLVLLFAFTVAYFAKIMVAVALGRYLFTRFNAHFAESGYWSLTFGLFLLVLFTAVPYLGPLVSLIVTLLGFGALWQEGRKGWLYRLTWHSDDPVQKMEVSPA